MKEKLQIIKRKKGIKQKLLLKILNNEPLEKGEKKS